MALWEWLADPFDVNAKRVVFWPCGPRDCINLLLFTNATLANVLFTQEHLQLLLTRWQFQLLFLRQQIYQTFLWWWGLWWGWRGWDGGAEGEFWACSLAIARKRNKRTAWQTWSRSKLSFFHCFFPENQTTLHKTKFFYSDQTLYARVRVAKALALWSICANRTVGISHQNDLFCIREHSFWVTLTQRCFKIHFWIVEAPTVKLITQVSLLYCFPAPRCCS